jgi:hypothetical protein
MILVIAQVAAIGSASITALSADAGSVGKLAGRR